MQYYIGIQGVRTGPFSEAEVLEKLSRGEIPADALCWTDGWTDWAPISTFPTSGGARPPALPPFSPGSPVTGHHPQPVPSGPPETSGLAITSLVLGILGFIGGLTAIPAVICGHIACSNIKGSQGTQKGRGLAITGLVLGYMMIALAPIGLMAAMAIPAFQKVRAVSQEKAILNNLRQLDAAAQQYMLENGVHQASYANLVGSGPAHYIRNLTPVAGEDYSSLVIRATDSEISVTTGEGRVITLPLHYTSPNTSFAPVEAR